MIFDVQLCLMGFDQQIAGGPSRAAGLGPFEAKAFAGPVVNLLDDQAI